MLDGVRARLRARERDVGRRRPVDAASLEPAEKPAPGEPDRRTKPAGAEGEGLRGRAATVVGLQQALDEPVGEQLRAVAERLRLVAKGPRLGAKRRRPLPLEIARAALGRIILRADHPREGPQSPPDPNDARRFETSLPGTTAHGPAHRRRWRVGWRG